MEHTSNTLQLEKRVSILEEQVRQLQTQLAELELSQEETPTVAQTESLPFVVQEPEPVVMAESPVVASADNTTVEEESTQMEETPFEDENETVISPISTEEAETHLPKPEEKEVPLAAIDQPKPVVHAKEEVSLESKIGKKLIPIAGSALILIALVLFGSLIKPRLTDEAKAIIMAVISLSITAVGLWKMKPDSKYHIFFSALAGCGVSACYISSLVAHFGLEVLPEAGLMVCIAVWITAMILLSKYKAKMFSYICYVGILVAAYMTIRRWNDNPIGLLSYLISIGALFAANFTKEYKKAIWYFLQLPLVLFPMTWAYDDDFASLAIIFGTTVVALVGQIAYYQNKTEHTDIFIFPTILSFPPTALSCLFMSDKLGDVEASLLFAATMIGLCIYYYRTFVIGKTVSLQIPFWILYMIAAVVLPILEYGTIYKQYSGMFLLPAILTIALGYCLLHKVFVYSGFIYAFLFSLSMPKAYQIILDSDVHLQFGCWIYAAMVASIYLWSRRDNSKQILYLSMGGFAWFLCTLFRCHWIDPAIVYILLAGYGFIINTRWFKIEGDMSHEKIIQYATFVVAAIGFLLGTPDFQDARRGALLIDMPNSIGYPLCGMAMITLLGGIGYLKQNRIMVRTACVFLPLYFFNIHHEGCKGLSLCIYAFATAALIYYAIRNYSLKEKGVATFISISLIALTYRYDFIGFTEFWMLCAMSSIGMLLSRFCYDPRNGNEEEQTRRFCLIYNGILTFIGMLLLRYDKSALFIGHTIEGTDAVVTSLLILLTMALSAADVRYLYQHLSSEKERKISIYQGAKFTILFWIILKRFSTVSYIITIIGILLSVFFVASGFKYRFKGMRLYGLGLSILCVIKLIFFDIVFDNAYYRAGSFLVAGMLLFLISFIYFKLEKKNGEIEATENSTD